MVKVFPAFATAAGLVGRTVAAMSQAMSTPLDSYKIAFEVAGDELHLQLEVQTEGWIGFGISRGTGMRGADIVTIAADGSVEDTHSLAKTTPIKDCKQDWTVISHIKANGKTIAKIKRKLDTGDVQDTPIVDDKHSTPIIIAHGDSNAKTVMYHALDRRTMSINFFGATPTLDTFYANKDVKQLHHRTHDCSDETNPFVVPTPGNVDDVTNIINFCMDLPADVLSTPAHMVAFEQYLTPGNEALVHHYVLYGSDKTCAEHGGKVFNRLDTQECPTLWAWQTGTGDFIFPSNMGFPIGKGTTIKSLINNVHYDNPTQTKFKEDASGITIHYTTKMRPFHMAVINVGDPTVWMGGQEVMIKDTKAPEALHGFECPASHFSKHDLGGANSLKVVASLLHMHRAGDYIRTDIVDGNGKVKQSWSHNFYDGNFQGTINFGTHVEYKKGDRAKVTCVWDNKLKNPKKDKLKFGIQGDEEMCMDFWYVYSENINIATELGDKIQNCGMGVSPGARHWTKPVWDRAMELDIPFAGAVDAQCKSTIPSMTKPTYKMYTVGATKMSVGQVGADNAEHTVVALHGFPQGSAMWFPVFAPTLLKMLGGKARVVAPDMRGVNRTMPKYSCKDVGCANYHPKVIADEVAALLKTHFGAITTKVHLVGHDWGAVIAWYLAIYHKELFATLTVLDVAHPSVFWHFYENHAGQKRATDSYVPMMIKSDNTYTTMKPVIGQPMNPMLSGVIDVADDQEADYRDAWVHRDALKHHMYWYRGSSGFKAFKDIDVKSAIIGADLPVLQIWGEKDTGVLPGAICCLKSVVSKLHVEVLVGATHWTVDERGHEVAEFVKKHMQGEYTSQENDKCSQTERHCGNDLEAICAKGAVLPKSGCDATKYPDTAFPANCIKIKTGEKAPSSGKYWADDGTVKEFAVPAGAPASKAGMFCPVDGSGVACDLCRGKGVNSVATWVDQSTNTTTSCAQTFEGCAAGRECGRADECGDYQNYFLSSTNCCAGAPSKGCDVCAGEAANKTATYAGIDGEQESCLQSYNYCKVPANARACGVCSDTQKYFKAQGCCIAEAAPKIEPTKPPTSQTCDMCNGYKPEPTKTYVDPTDKRTLKCADTHAWCLTKDCLTASKATCGQMQEYFATPHFCCTTEKAASTTTTGAVTATDSTTTIASTAASGRRLSYVFNISAFDFGRRLDRHAVDPKENAFKCTAMPVRGTPKGSVTMKVTIPGTVADYQTASAKRALLESFLSSLNSKEAKPSWVKIDVTAARRLAGGDDRRLAGNVEVKYIITIPSGATMDKSTMTKTIGAMNSDKLAKNMKQQLGSVNVAAAATIPTNLVTSCDPACPKPTTPPSVTSVPAAGNATTTLASLSESKSVLGAAISCAAISGSIFLAIAQAA